MAITPFSGPMPNRRMSDDDFSAACDSTFLHLPTVIDEFNVESAAINSRIEQIGNIDQQAVMWVSGATYSQGVAVWSPLTFQTYRRKVSGAGTIDPSIDDANWQPIGASLAQLHAAALSF